MVIYMVYYPGVDNIPYELILQLPPSYKLAILKLYNRIWQESTYPTKWREAIIVPIIKQGKDPNHLESYRPISLTCCMSKILEKMVNTRLMWFLERHRLLADHQMGFRKYRSTTDQLVQLEHKIQTSFAERRHVVALFFDIEKAYDMTWRFGILKALHSWGIRGNLPKFIESFLKGRYFKVRVGNDYSNLTTLENGIPQGSTLSVTLFAIAVNDIAHNVDPEIETGLYVDDLTIYLSGRSMEYMEERLQVAINTIAYNANRRGFRLSPTKTKCVHFCRLRTPHNDPQLTIEGRNIEVVPQVRFLGVIFDKKLSWKPHIEDLAARCKKSLNIIRCLAHINWGANSEILVRMYKSMILSKMDYGSIVYSGARKSHLKKLDTVHGMGLRLAIGAYRTSPLTSIYSETGVPPLHIRRSRLMLNYGTNIWAQPEHPNHAILFNEENEATFEARPTITRPVGIRIKEHLNRYGYSFPYVYQLNFNETPPWKLNPPIFRLDNIEFRKSDTIPALYFSRFHGIVAQYPDSLIIYTDGSKTEQGVGSAFSSHGESYAWSLHPWTSIFTAELYAIWQALEFSESQTLDTILICIDSLSAIQAIQKTYSSDPLVQKILTRISNLQELGKKYILVWIPSHIGITGNEIADKAAKDVTAQEPDEHIKICTSDVKAYFKSKMKNIWQNEWNGSESKLKEIKPSVEPWCVPCKLTRREEVAITRMRLGHTRLTSCHLLLGTGRPRCPTCLVRLTVKHILLDCTEYENIRNQLRLPDSLRECLTNRQNILNVVHFLKESNLFYKI